jgi:hypothetical protein
LIEFHLTSSYFLFPQASAAIPTIMFAFVFAALVLASPALSSTVQVVNRCSFDTFLFTQTSDGTIKQNNVFVAPGATLSMGVSSDWNGAINVGKC